MDEQDRITGPLGFWTFPVLNTIIEIVRLRNTDTTELPPVEVIKDDEGNVKRVEIQDE